MANALEMLLAGNVDDFNEYRRKNPDTELDFEGVKLPPGLDLSWVNLAGVGLRGAVLAGVQLQRVELGGADLRQADLRGADLSYADLREAKIGEVLFNTATVFEGTRFSAQADFLPRNMADDEYYELFHNTIILLEVLLNCHAMKLGLPPAIKLLER